MIASQLCEEKVPVSDVLRETSKLNIEFDTG